MHKFMVFAFVVALTAYAANSAPHGNNNVDEDDNLNAPADVITDVNQQISDTLGRILDERKKRGTDVDDDVKDDENNTRDSEFNTKDISDAVKTEYDESKDKEGEEDEDDTLEKKRKIDDMDDVGDDDDDLGFRKRRGFEDTLRDTFSPLSKNNNEKENDDDDDDDSVEEVDEILDEDRIKRDTTIKEKNETHNSVPKYSAKVKVTPYCSKNNTQKKYRSKRETTNIEDILNGSHDVDDVDDDIDDDVDDIEDDFRRKRNTAYDEEDSLKNIRDARYIDDGDDDDGDIELARKRRQIDNEDGEDDSSEDAADDNEIHLRIRRNVDDFNFRDNNYNDEKVKRKGYTNGIQNADDDNDFNGKLSEDRSKKTLPNSSATASSTSILDMLESKDVSTESRREDEDTIGGDDENDNGDNDDEDNALTSGRMKREISGLDTHYKDTDDDLVQQAGDRLPKTDELPVPPQIPYRTSIHKDENSNYAINENQKTPAKSAQLVDVNPRTKHMKPNLNDNQKYKPLGGEPSGPIAIQKKLEKEYLPLFSRNPES